MAKKKKKDKEAKDKPEDIKLPTKGDFLVSIVDTVDEEDYAHRYEDLVDYLGSGLFSHGGNRRFGVSDVRKRTVNCKTKLLG